MSLPNARSDFVGHSFSQGLGPFFHAVSRVLFDISIWLLNISEKFDLSLPNSHPFRAYTAFYFRLRQKVHAKHGRQYDRDTQVS